jgi:hypothetical protein
MTRGLRGCYVYAMDEEVRQRLRLAATSADDGAEAQCWVWRMPRRGLGAVGMRLKLCAHSQIVRSQNHWHNDCLTSSRE